MSTPAQCGALAQWVSARFVEEAGLNPGSVP